MNKEMAGQAKAKMRVTFIGCPFKTSYGPATESLKKAMEKRMGDGEVEWVASNCGCGDDVEIARQFQMQGCKYFDMINIPDTPPRLRALRQAPLFWLQLKARELVYYFRAKKYRNMSKGAEVVHFQQTLHAYGSTVIFYWLNQESSGARVVTIHELDKHQLESPAQNKTYNKADAIIVQQGAMKDQLIRLGVDPSKIEIVPHGTDLPTIDEKQPREGIVFFGGHHPLTGKGLLTLYKAMTLLKERLGSKTPRLKVHGYFSAEDLRETKRLARERGLENDITWFNQIPMEEMYREYQSSLMCVLPFVGSFAGLPASVAAAVELPIIATKNAGIPEHIGDCGIWIDNENAEQLADRIEEVLGSKELRRDLSKRLRKRAEQYLSWDAVADGTLAVYRRALNRKNHGFLEKVRRDGARGATRVGAIASFLEKSGG
jgi:glycosyltransferase involved in cell wall biosynthesis